MATIRKVNDFVFYCEDTYSATYNLPILLISDIHFDSKSCDRKLLKKHLNTIKKKNGKVIINGDLFDVMGCYKDPRTKPTDIRSEYIKEGRSYLDLIIDDVFEFLKPYAKNILFIGAGNHETAILKYRDTDPIKRLADRLRDAGSKLEVGGYRSYIKFIFRSKSGDATRSKLLYLHHGYGNARRSKGMLHNQIDAFRHPDADIIAKGHDHQKWYDPSNVRYKLLSNGKVSESTIHVLRTGSYKNCNMKTMGFEVEKDFNPVRLGGWFLNFEYLNRDIHIKIEEAS